MAINFTGEKQKRLKYLVVILIVLVVVTLFVFSKSFFVKESVTPSQKVFQLKTVKINFDVLKDPFLEELQVFEEISYPEEMEIGRENPFIPY
ncbi:hypothetical protein KAU51_03470 [Candidatus Parcubacteria bacterium]|nr:hypothetical protein [Candidatus Parcubacteria bacterium]